ncbi:MAG: thermonuclease family protein [Paenibacillaceae bacterium]|nr:thermonuclease family protein [Paenibacillaceae bacterium]
MVKRLLTFVFCTLLAATALVPAGASAEVANVPVFIDGKKINFEVEPQLINGYTMVPLRQIFKTLGASITWDGPNMTVIAKKKDILITYTIGSYTADRNGEKLKLDEPGQIVDGNTMVPARFISEALGATVGWEGVSRTVLISSKPMTEVEVLGFDGEAFDIRQGSKLDKLKFAAISVPFPGGQNDLLLKQILADLQENRVYVEVDTKERDAAGHLLGYVYMKDGSSYNAKLLVDGDAQMDPDSPNVRWFDLFKRLQTDAKNAARGMWQ